MVARLTAIIILLVQIPPSLPQAIYYTSPLPYFTRLVRCDITSFTPPVFTFFHAPFPQIWTDKATMALLAAHPQRRLAITSETGGSATQPLPWRDSKRTFLIQFPFLQLWSPKPFQVKRTGANRISQRSCSSEFLPSFRYVSRFSDSR
jgi:hypothetical protein